MKYNNWKILLYMLVAIGGCPAAWAWELHMNGAVTWEFDYRIQQGHKGFFGPYNVDAGSGIPGAVPGFYAPLNGWVGSQGRDMVSGTEGAWQTQYMTGLVELKANEAVKARGTYYIGEWAPAGPVVGRPSDLGWGELARSQYVSNRYPGVQRSFSPMYWNTLWVSAKMPWGTVSFGKRPHSFGTGLYWDGAESRSTESLGLSTCYGPFMFGLLLDLCRWATPPNDYHVSTASPPVNSFGYYNWEYDKSNKRWLDLAMPVVTYRTGSLDMGAMTTFLRWQWGGEGVLNAPTGPGSRETAPYGEVFQYFGGAYVKYFNGRVFLNSEVDWCQMTMRAQQRLPGGAMDLAGTGDFYVENVRTMVELGAVTGPLKSSCLYAWCSGPERRGGVPLRTTGLTAPPSKDSNPFANTGLFAPYSYLMVYSYGLGTHINTDTRNGYVDDASLWGARLDYALAANLNVSLATLQAQRTTKSGYGWGFIRPVDPATGRFGVTYDMGSRGGAPSIPDPDLGWEIDAGIDWQLLEGFHMNGTFAFWQPGKWFAYACVDKSIPDWAVTTVFPWGANPDRQIDPMVGMELRMNMLF